MSHNVVIWNFDISVTRIIDGKSTTSTAPLSLHVLEESYGPDKLRVHRMRQALERLMREEGWLEAKGAKLESSTNG